MHRDIRSLAFIFGYLGHATIVISTPALAPQTTGSVGETPQNACKYDKSSCNRPPDASIYVCENINWQPPCQLLHLDVVNGEQYGWGEGPEWSDGSSMVGSWGPAPGILTVLWSEHMQNSTSATDPEYTYPGTPDVGPFWRTNTYDYYASWDPTVDPSTLPKTAEAAFVPAPTAINSGSRGRVRNDGTNAVQHPWWIQQAYFS